MHGGADDTQLLLSSSECGAIPNVFTLLSQGSTLRNEDLSPFSSDLY